MKNQKVRKLLTQMNADLRQYRAQMGRLFTRKLSRPPACSKYFFDTLVITSKLYSDYLLLKQMEPELYAEDPRPKRRPPITFKASRATGNAREQEFRSRLRTRLQTLECLAHFQPENEFVEDNHLISLDDYLRKLGLHLSDIYGETFEMKRSIRRLVEDREFAAVAELIVGFAHIAHHASYGRHALELLSEEWRWS